MECHESLWHSTVEGHREKHIPRHPLNGQPQGVRKTKPSMIVWMVHQAATPGIHLAEAIQPRLRERLADPLSLVFGKHGTRSLVMPAVRAIGDAHG